VVSVTDPFTGTVEYGYDLAGNRTRLVYPGGEVVTYTYDADNRLVQIEDWDGGLTRYAYEAGRLTAATLPNAVQTTYEHDAANRLTQIAHRNAGDDLLARYVYLLDGVGNWVQATETISTPGQGLVTTAITYTYDSLYRLSEADYSSGERFEYAYDAVGNRMIYTATVAGTNVITYLYDTTNRLVNVDGVDYTWDDLGRLENDGTYTYSWDGAGRLITATDGIMTLAYRYDGDGNRLARSVNGTSTTYTLDVALALPEVIVAFDGDTTWYLHLPHSIATDDGTAWTYNAADGLGSVRQRLDESGQIDGELSYRPFGSPLVGDSGDPYGFTGEWWEAEIESLYLRARYLQVETGRFISPDPWLGDYQRPMSLNRWIYVEGNPINRKDPSGLYWWGAGQALWEASEQKVRSQNVHVRIQALMMWGRMDQIHAEYIIPGTNWPVDLLDSLTGEVWEIKPWDDRSEAVSIVDRNIREMNMAREAGLLRGINPVGLPYDWNFAPLAWFNGYSFPTADVYVGTDDSGWFDIYATQTQPGVILWWKYERPRPEQVPYPVILPDPVSWGPRNRRPDWKPILVPEPAYCPAPSSWDWEIIYAGAKTSFWVALGGAVIYILWNSKGCVAGPWGCVADWVTPAF
jgi:RHS repeat-associated protein